jgi:hypothetical protein
MAIKFPIDVSQTLHDTTDKQISYGFDRASSILCGNKNAN